MCIRDRLGPEAFDAQPFLDLLTAPKPVGYGSPWQLQERTPSVLSAAPSGSVAE